MDPTNFSKILEQSVRMEPDEASTPPRPRLASAPSELPLLGKPVRHLSALHRAWELADDRSRVAGLSSDLWPDPTQQRRAEAALTALLEPGGLVILAGPRGTGKTFLAVWLAWRVWRDRMRDGHQDRGRLAYAVWGEILGDEMESWKSKDKTSAFAVLRRASLLVVDELHALSGKPFEDQQLERMMDQRYRDMSRTILCTNHEPAALWGALPASVVSRIQETGVVATVDGADRRKS